MLTERSIPVPPTTMDSSSDGDDSSFAGALRSVFLMVNVCILRIKKLHNVGINSRACITPMGLEKVTGNKRH